jgi:hypothetical protein
MPAIMPPAEWRPIEPMGRPPSALLSSMQQILAGCRVERMDLRSPGVDPVETPLR